MVNNFAKDAMLFATADIYLISKTLRCILSILSYVFDAVMILFNEISRNAKNYLKLSI